MWLSGMQRPDFNTINLFRKHRLAGFIDNIFTQVVEMLVDAKLISLDVQYIDGTKIELRISDNHGKAVYPLVHLSEVILVEMFLKVVIEV